MKPFYKILLIVGIMLVVGLGIFFGWQKITGPPVKSADTKLPTEVATTSPAIAPKEEVSTKQTPGLKKLSDHNVFDYWVVPDTKEAYYLEEDGKVWAAKEGEDIKISGQTIAALNFIETAPGNKKILVAFQDPRAPQWGIFDVVDGVWRPLPQDIENAAWGGGDDKLVAVRKNNNELSLVEIDLSKNPPSYKTFIRDFRFKDIDLAWKTPMSVIITEKPAASYAGRIWELDLEKLNIYLLHAADFGLTIKWGRSPYVLKFASPDRFSVLNQNLQEIVPVFFTTLPDKCVVTETSLYCFVPEELPANITLPDDYFQDKFYSIDELWEVNLESGAAQKILSSNESAVPALDGENPYYLDGVLYFMNRYDKQLYSLTLTKS